MPLFFFSLFLSKSLVFTEKEKKTLISDSKDNFLYGKFLSTWGCYSYNQQIIRRANESGENPFALSDRFCQEYLSDMADLQCLSPTHQPRVSDHLEQIKDMITQVESLQQPNDK